MKIKINDLSFKYRDNKVLENISCKIPANGITAVSGPSGAGKSTFLLCLNRLWEDHFQGEVKGSVLSFLDEKWIDIYDKSVSLPWLRQKTGMVFQHPNPFPMSIEKNLLFPLRLGTSPLSKSGNGKDEVVNVLKKVYLYDEVKERVNTNALSLSGGQQQRLCIARALMAKPEILLLDEPTSSLDKRAEKEIEELLVELKSQCTIIIVSHSTGQINRLVDHIIEIDSGRLLPIQ